jgi:AcrR family transcriptional regulator
MAAMVKRHRGDAIFNSKLPQEEFMSKIVHHLFGSDQGRRLEMADQVFSRAAKLTESEAGENISVEDILDVSGISRRTFYKLFKSVDDYLKSLGQTLANDLIKYFKYIAIESPDYAVRVATKTRIGILLLTKIPLIGRLLLNADWHGRDVNNFGLKDIESDILGGIRQGRFSDVPASIGVNIVIGGMKAAVREIIEKREPPEFADLATMQILIGLGVDTSSARELSKVPLPELPSLAEGGFSERISKLRNGLESD